MRPRPEIEEDCKWVKWEVSLDNYYKLELEVLLDIRDLLQKFVQNQA